MQDTSSHAGEATHPPKKRLLCCALCVAYYLLLIAHLIPTNNIYIYIYITYLTTHPPNTSQPRPVAKRSLQFPVTDVASAERSNCVSMSLVDRCGRVV